MAKQIPNNTSMRQELRRYMLSLSILGTLFFTFAMVMNYTRGVESGVFTTLMLDVRTYEKAYLKDPKTPLPQYYSAWFSLDNFNNIPDRFQQHIPFSELQPHEYFDRQLEVESANNEREDNDYRLIIGYRHVMPDQRDLYLAIDIDATHLTPEDVDQINPDVLPFILLATSYVIITLLVIAFYNRRTNQKINLLAKWAEQLDLSNLNQPRPSFHYAELEQIADQLHTSVQNMAETLAREHQFLRHASHELRTPIAVIRANLELLDKLPSSQQQQEPLARLQRANKGMQDTVETMLWLSRDSDSQQLAYEAVDVAEMIQRLEEELGHFLNDKNIQVDHHINSQNTVHQLPVTAFYIVLSNLIRNAFQYTSEGVIDVSLSDDAIIITNQEYQQDFEHEHTTGDSNGLGLLLVQRICQHLDWQFELTPLPNGMRAMLKLS